MLVPPKGIEALADAIEMLLANDTLRRKLCCRARRHAEEKFDLWRTGQRLADLLRATKRLRIE